MVCYGTYLPEADSAELDHLRWRLLPLSVLLTELVASLTSWMSDMRLYEGPEAACSRS